MKALLSGKAFNHEKKRYLPDDLYLGSETAIATAIIKIYGIKLWRRYPESETRLS